MSKRKPGFGILTVMLIFGMAVVEANAQAARVSDSDLVGMWELESVQNRPKSELIGRMVFFNDNFGIDCYGFFRWQLTDENKLCFGVIDYDIELSENGTLLIFHYSGFNYTGQYPAKGKYRKVTVSSFGEQADNSLIGTWLNENVELKFIFYNGSFEVHYLYSGIIFAKGAYIRSDEKIAMIKTHFHGGVFSMMFENIENRLYTIKELKPLLYPSFLFSSEYYFYYDMIPLFSTPVYYSLSGNVFVLMDINFTRVEYGSENNLDPRSAFFGTWVYDGEHSGHFGDSLLTDYTVFSQYDDEKDFTFEIFDRGRSIIITGYVGTRQDISIPSQIQGLPVTRIGRNAFSGREIRNVTIPSSVTWICFFAFSNNQLTYVTIPPGVNTIGGWAFSNNQLTSVTIPSSVTHFVGSAFENNQLTSVTIQPGVTRIGSTAFRNNQLTSVTIPPGMTEIGSSAFAGNQLSYVTIPSSVTRIGAGAFANSSLQEFKVEENNQNYVSIDGILFNRERTSIIAFPGGKTGHYTIPSYITCIRDSAFSNGNLTSVTIPSSVTTIGSAAFYNNQLTSVTIYPGVTTIGNSAFSGNQLTSVTIPPGVTEIGRAAFLHNQLTSVTIPPGVTTIESSAFSGNQLTNVTIPPGVTEIGSMAFSRNQLTNVTIPPSVTEIEWGAFGSNQLVNVTIPPSVLEIGNGAFANNRLTSVTISPGVTVIRDSAFRHNQLTSVTIPSSVTEIGAGAFAGFSLQEFIVDENNLNYVSIDEILFNKERTRIIAFPGGKTGHYTIPGHITAIGDSVFSNGNLTSITIPYSVTTIGNSAFLNNQLTSVTIPPSVTEIGWGAFFNNHLTSITIPPGVTEIRVRAFSDNQLTSVTIPSGVTEIGAFAFYNNQLTSITIPYSVTEIGPSAFYDNQLTIIDIGANVTIIEEIERHSGQFPAFENGFAEFYDEHGRIAGRYSFSDGSWIRHE